MHMAVANVKKMYLYVFISILSLSVSTNIYTNGYYLLLKREKLTCRDEDRHQRLVEILG